MGKGWLKRAAQIALKIGVGIDTFGPMVKGFTPDRVDRWIDAGGDYVSKGTDIILQAEIMGQALSLSGQDKLKAATPAMAQLILKSDALVGRKIDDPVKFERGVAAMTSGLADILNSLDDKVETV